MQFNAKPKQRSLFLVRINPSQYSQIRQSQNIETSLKLLDIAIKLLSDYKTG